MLKLSEGVRCLPSGVKLVLPRSCIPASDLIQVLQDVSSAAPTAASALYKEAARFCSICHKDATHLCQSTSRHCVTPVALALSPQSMAHQGWEWAESSAKAAHQSMAAPWSGSLQSPESPLSYHTALVGLASFPPPVPDHSQHKTSGILTCQGMLSIRKEPESSNTWWVHLIPDGAVIKFHFPHTGGTDAVHQSTELTQTTTQPSVPKGLRNFT